MMIAFDTIMTLMGIFIAGPIVLIALAVEKHNYKKNMAVQGCRPVEEDVTWSEDAGCRMAGMGENMNRANAEIGGHVIPETNAASGSDWGPVRHTTTAAETKATVRPQKSKPDFKVFQGTAALIIGVVFVVLAGLIFATTAWHTLPNFSKVIMIVAFSGLFFGASRLAEKIFKIEKTSQAFYILGSVFLFLTVLAAGYFGILGRGFTLAEEHRYKVLFAGSLATELALLVRINRFQERIYTKACFWGLSVIMFFFLKALSLGTADSIRGMACYSALLILADELTEKRRANLPSYLNANVTSFAGFHFWVFSVFLVVIAVVEGLVFGIDCLINGEAAVSLLTTAALGMTAAAIAVMTLKRGHTYLKVLHSISIIAFFYYLGMSIKVDFIYQVFVSTLMTGAWLLVKKRANTALGSIAGDVCYTVVLVFNTAVLLYGSVLNWDSVGELLAASAAVILLTAVMSGWSRRYPVIRPYLPYFLCPVTVTVNGMLAQAGTTFSGFRMIVFLFLLAVTAWDLCKRDRFGLFLVITGTAAQLLFWTPGTLIPPYALLLTGYLLVQSVRAEERMRALYETSGCVYLLAGIFFLTEGLMADYLPRLLCVTAVYVAEYAAARWYRRDEINHRFWNVTGIVIFGLNMMAFYLAPGLGAGYAVACLSVFAVFYVLFYRSGSKWLQLAAVLMVLPMQQVVGYRYALTEHQLYGYTALVLLVSGLLARRYVPIITCRGDSCKEWEYDWFNILAVLVLVPMTLSAGEGWRCVYLLLLALYLLQYTVIQSLRREALTFASALVMAAFWIQPFVGIPDVVYLEVQMAPTVMFLWFMGCVWKESRSVTVIQNTVYAAELAILVLTALRSGLVVDALILEVVCLFVFMRSNVKNNVVWQRISGTVIVAVALYMTKAFWLSLSWWVYLLAAGLGLIAFAAANEMKKR